MYLLDTNVVSELRRARPHGAVIAWLGSVNVADLRMSAVTLGELQAGIERSRENDPTRAREIETWLEEVLGQFEILPMEGETFRLSARLMHRRSPELFEDAMIAATAMTHHLTVVTRNVRDFMHWNVPLLNPFLPPET